jgi:hypothetical protein
VNSPKGEVSKHPRRNKIRRRPRPALEELETISDT